MLRPARASGFAVVLLFLSDAAARAASQSEPELLQRVHAAVGARDPTPGRVVLEGEADHHGTPATFRFSFDGEGGFEHEVRGPLGETAGSDGSRTWWIDRTGAPRFLSFEDADEWRAIADLLAGRWLDDESLGKTRRGDSLALAFPSGMVEELTLDPDTCLPSRAAFDLHAGRVVVETSDWRAVGSRKHPFRYRITAGSLTDTFEVRTSARVPADPAGFRAPALERPHDHAFERDETGEIEVRPSPIHLLLVHPSVDGQDVGWFIFDTGAEVMCIDPEVADRLHLPRIGRIPLTGVGGTVPSAFRRAAAFQLGPLTLRQPLFCELDLTSLLPLLREKVAGIVGYDYLYRAIVEIDTDAPTLAVFDPATYRLQGAAWRELRYSAGNPAVQAGLEGDRSGWFLLDTGDPSDATFFTPFVDEQHLLDGRTTSAASSGGVGGTIAARAGAVAWLELGGHRFEDVGVLFSRATSGTFATRGLAGSIGQKLMAPFRLVFDFGGARVAFVPRE